MVALVILLTANLFVDVRVEHPVAMLAFLVLWRCAFSLFGFVRGSGPRASSSCR
jgi:ABC-2 type transport system permease protein